MVAFFVFLMCGFMDLWALLMMWGFSAGPKNAVPYVALVGSIILLLVAAPLSLFAARFAAVAALLGSCLILVWPLAVAASEASPMALLFALPPTLAAFVAARQIWGPRQTAWLALGSRSPVWLRVVLSAVPLVLFVACFNAGPVLAVLLAGPPR